jgi:hypothetical protein
MGGDDGDEIEEDDEDEDEDDNMVDSANKGRLCSLSSLRYILGTDAFSRFHNSGLIFD